MNSQELLRGQRRTKMVQRNYVGKYFTLELRSKSENFKLFTNLVTFRPFNSFSTGCTLGQ